jgi:hypothetical protein
LVTVVDCQLGGAGSMIACTAACEGTEIDAMRYGLSCDVSVPPIDYSTSPFYNSIAKRLVLPDNSLNVSIRFNDGELTRTVTLGASLGAITITPAFRCGDGVCHTDLGEDKNTCCRDCGCNSGYLCYRGLNQNGTCVATDSVNMEMGKFDPDPVNCTIYEKGGECVFVNSVDVSAHIINAANDLRILGSLFTYENKEYNMECFATPYNQTANYTCAFTLPAVSNESGGSMEGVITKTLGLKLSVAYTAGNHTIIQNLSASSDIRINKVKSSDLRSCQEEQAKIDKQIKDLEDDKSLIETIIIVIWSIALGFLAAYIISCIGGCVPWLLTAFLWGACIATCLTSILLPMLDNAKSQMETLKAQRQGMCGSQGSYDQYTRSVAGSANTGTLMVAALLGIVCAVCLIALTAGGGSGAAAGGGGGGGAGGIPQSGVVHPAQIPGGFNAPMYI